MIQEKLQNKVNEIAINVQQSRFESIRKKDITKTAIRVYDNDCIGISSGIGEINEEELTKKAIDGLQLQIPYPVSPEKDKTKSILPPEPLMSEDTFIENMSDLLNDLRVQNPQFSFSNKLILRKSHHTLINDAGLSLSQSIELYQMSLLINHQDSSNLFDAAMGYQSNHYDRTIVSNYIHELCQAYNNPLQDFQDGDYPILFDSTDQTYLAKLLRDLHGHLFVSGSSLFSDRIGECLFQPSFSLFTTRSPQDYSSVPFFDLEGVFHEDYRFPLIRNGILESPYTDKKTAQSHHFTPTGSAGGSYDSVPTIGVPMTFIPSTGKTIEEILQGEKGIVVVMASGGDFTPDGHFGTPVQLSYLFDGKNFVGRLPQISLSSEVFSMFGKDFMGVSSNSLFPLDDSRQTLIRMKVNKIS